MKRGQRGWLVKSEPEDFSIGDLERAGPTPWTGIRNYQARNVMRDEMRDGDPVLFYHSGSRAGEVVGIARVSGSAYPDPTQFDPASPYYDSRSATDAPRWWLVDLEFVEKLPRAIPLAELRTHAGLREMVLLNHPRLSVQPISAEELTQIRTMAKSR